MQDNSCSRLTLINHSLVQVFYSAWDGLFDSISKLQIQHKQGRSTLWNITWYKLTSDSGAKPLCSSSKWRKCCFFCSLVVRANAHFPLGIKKKTFPFVNFLSQGLSLFSIHTSARYSPSTWNPKAQIQNCTPTHRGWQQGSTLLQATASLPSAVRTIKSTTTCTQNVSRAPGKLWLGWHTWLLFGTYRRKYPWHCKTR